MTTCNHDTTTCDCYTSAELSHYKSHDLEKMLIQVKWKIGDLNDSTPIETRGPVYRLRLEELTLHQGWLERLLDHRRDARRLTLPGQLPALFRLGSPVRDSDRSEHCGVVLDAGPIHVSAVFFDELGTRDVHLPNCGGGLELLSLRLDDATGRTHATWWLESQFFTATPFGIWISNGDLSWDLHREGADNERFTAYVSDIGHHIPGLDALDLNDDRKLPDGTPWVSVEALRIVCMHYAGLGVGS